MVSQKVKIKSVLLKRYSITTLWLSAIFAILKRSVNKNLQIKNPHFSKWGLKERRSARFKEKSFYYQIKPLLSKYFKILLRYSLQGAPLEERHEDLSSFFTQMQSSQLSGMKEEINLCKSSILSSPFCLAFFLKDLIFIHIILTVLYVYWSNKSARQKMAFNKRLCIWILWIIIF